MEQEEHNHQPSLSSARIETLSDGVFAIAMTLLVLNLAVEKGLDHQGFKNMLYNLWPQAGAYIVSFMVLAVYWIGHHNQYFWIKHSDRHFLWINVFFLMFIALLPFSTNLLASYRDETFAVLIYGFNVIVCGLVLYIHWRYATGTGNLIHGYLDHKLRETMGNRILVGIVFYIISTLACFISTKISLVLFALVPFIYMIPSSIDTFLKIGNQSK